MMRRALLIAVVLATSVGFMPWHARADDGGFSAAQRAEIVTILRDALKADPSILRDAIAALQAQEAVVKDSAARTAIERAGPALTGNAGDPFTGNPAGDVTVVEFYDLRCPYCRRMLPVVADLLHQDANIRLVYKDIPILGAASVLGARAVLAAQRQGGYERLHDAIMNASPDITGDSLREAAAASGLDWAKLQQDMADPAIAARIAANLTLARDLGVDGTPVYVIGGQMLPGAVELADLKGAIAAARAH